MILEVFCETCNGEYGIRTGPVALVDTDELSLPLMGSMFKSIDEAHGYPAPFNPRAEWEHLNCPTCGFRAIKHKDRVLTKNGHYVVGSKEIPGVEPTRVREVWSDDDLEREWNQRLEALGQGDLTEAGDSSEEPGSEEKPYVCEVCGAGFQSPMALYGHMKKHRGKKNAN